MKTRLWDVLSKRTVTVMFAFTLFLFGVFAWSTSEETAYAAEYTSWDATTYENYAVAQYSADVVKTYIGKTAPTVDGYLFAGWFTAPTCTEAQSVASATKVVSGTTYYAKFVPEDVLSIKVQLSNGDANAATTAVEKSMRFISTVDDATYVGVGFNLKYQNANQKWVYKIQTDTSVYNRIATITDKTFQFSPKVVDTNSEYFITSTWDGENQAGIASADFNKDYFVRAYWITYDGIHVYGPTRCVSVNDYLNSNIVNLSVKDTAKNFSGKTLKASYVNSAGATKSASSVELYHDGTYAHMSINLGSGVDRASALSSATKFTITDGTNTKTAIYRNLYTTHETTTTTPNADATWYNVYHAADSARKEYVIATSADLYGLEYLANYNGGSAKVTFDGMTIYLVSDIVVNKGAASVSSGWTASSGAKTYKWYAARGFAGTLDGQNHAISGLYGSYDTNTTSAHYAKGVGLLTETVNATIRNLSVTNSYFNSAITNGTAPVVGNGYGTFENIYTDSVVHSTKQANGGIVGTITGTTTISNCWSDTDIETSYYYSGGIVGNTNGKTVKIAHCLNSGNLTYTGTGNSYMGGLVGKTASTAGNLQISDSLHTGTVSGTSANKYMGSLMGNAGAVDTSGAETVTISDTYSVKNFKTDGTTALSVIGSDKRTAKTGTKVLTVAQLTGTNASANTTLSFAGNATDAYFATRSNNTPVLSYFADIAEKGIGVAKSDLAEFTLTNNVGYITNRRQFMDFAAKMQDEAFAATVNSKTVVYLKNNITFNYDDISGWSKAAPGWICTPIEGFPGTFDGQGHTLSGLYITGGADAKGVGLFTATTSTTVIKNLKVTNCYVESTDISGTGVVVGQGAGTFKNICVEAKITDGITGVANGNIGGIMGSATGKATFENCWNKATITSNRSYVGGIIGNANAKTVAVKHCLNTGTVTISASCTTTNAYAGGIIGKTGSGSASAGFNGSITIQDCLGVGVVQTKSTKTTKGLGGLIGCATGNTSAGKATVVVSNSYSRIGTTGVSCAVGTDYRADMTEGVAIDRMELIGIEAYHNTKLDFVTGSNTAGHWVCITSGTPILNYFVTSSDKLVDIDAALNNTFTLTNNVGYISNRSQLKDFATKMQDSTFASQVNSKTVVYLTDNITYNAGDAADWAAGTSTPTWVWTPIKGYPGTFDGQGYSIGGLYGKTVSGIKGYGLFTETTDTTVIKDLSVGNSYFIATSKEGTGGLVGRGSGTFTNIVTNVIIKDTAAMGSFGGIVGCVSGDLTIKNCFSKSPLSTYGQYAGGILGNTASVTGGYQISIIDCLNSGSIEYLGSTQQNLFYGGIVGRVASTASKNWSGSLTVKYCLNAGLVDVSKGYSGGILGYASGKVNGTKTTIINNCYSKLYFDATTGADVGATSIVGVWGADASQPNCAVIDGDNLTSGVHAYTYTNLKYWSSENTAGTWVIREGNIPMLKSFVSDTSTIVDPIEQGWTEFSLSANGNGKITNLYQLKSFADKQNAGTLGATSASTILLAADIVVSHGNRNDWAAGKNVTRQTWAPISGFPGKFNGQGHTISGVYGVGKSGINGVGLFTNTATTTTIQKFYLKNSYFESFDDKGTAAIVGRGAGLVWQVYADAIIHDAAKSGKVAGIVGEATGTLKIKSCMSQGDIKAYNLYAGGMLAVAGGNQVTIEYCLNTGDVTLYANTAVTATNAYLGGIIGKAGAGSGTTASPYKGTIKVNYSLNVGLIQSKHAKAVNTIGGIVGYATGAGTVNLVKSYSALTYDSYNEYNNVRVAVGNDKGATINGSECIDYDLMKGQFAYYYMDIDFYQDTDTTGYWYARENSHPMPVPFGTISSYPLITSFSVSNTTVDPVAFYSSCGYATSGGGAVRTYEDIGPGISVQITSTNATEFEAYATKLKANGMLQYGDRKTITSASSSAGVNRFYTFVGNGNNVYLAYFAPMKMTRIAIIPKAEETLLGLRTVKVNSAKDTVTPSMTQMQLEIAGMMYVAQLADGKYIIVDGGNGGSMTEDEYDKERLYQYMLKYMPSGTEKPVIACWMFTHPDPDHIKLAYSFIYNYATKVEVESFAYNFADEFVSQEGADADASIRNNVATLKKYMAKHPNAVHYTIHSGQTLSFKGLNIEILQTEEDMERLGSTSAHSSWNYTGASFRFNFTSGAKCLFCGDNNPINNDQLTKIYGSYLKSDMWQIPHHGLYGNTKTMSQKVNPSVAFVSSPKATFDDYMTSTKPDWYTYLTSSSRTWYYNDHIGRVIINSNGTISPQSATTMTVTLP